MSVRNRLLALLGVRREEKPALVKAPAPIIVVREEKKEASAQDNAPVANGAPTCPECKILLVNVAGDILRCPQCGEQSKLPPRRAPIPPVIAKPHATAPTACPSCGSSSPLQEIGGGGWRCQACGKQTGVEHPNGLSRKDLENYTGPPARAQMNRAPFFQASARMRGFGNR